VAAHHRDRDDHRWGVLRTKPLRGCQPVHVASRLSGRTA
jgi:hypothetical protein